MICGYLGMLSVEWEICLCLKKQGLSSELLLSFSVCCLIQKWNEVFSQANDGLGGCWNVPDHSARNNTDFSIFKDALRSKVLAYIHVLRWRRKIQISFTVLLLSQFPWKNVLFLTGLDSNIWIWLRVECKKILLHPPLPNSSRRT